MSDTLTILLGIFIPLSGPRSARRRYFSEKEMSMTAPQSAAPLPRSYDCGLGLVAADTGYRDVGKGSLPEWLPPLIGFLAGIGFLLLLDIAIPHLHADADKPEGTQSNAGRSLMLVLAVALHNLPEGMAVGVVFAGMLSGDTVISTAGALALSIGIALQNLPEGAIISMPLVGSGISRTRAFVYGFMSGVVEPAGAILTLLLTSIITSALPYILAFAAGAMIYVVVDELIPQAQTGEHSNIGTISTALGFSLMMVLDVALG